MKKFYFLIMFICELCQLNAQTRTSLMEEFTGETCVPCAAYNPAFNYLLNTPQNASKMIAIKWQVPIPTAPNNPSSLYQTNKLEIDWRQDGIGAGGYGYQHQNTSSGTPQDGIHNAPTCRIDGKNQWTFGAISNHPFHTDNNVISTAAAVPTPFSINMTTAWNSAFNNCVVTVTVKSSSAFTSNGNLMFRLCLVERYIEFQTAPGSNGEKIFEDVVRQSYPTTTSGGVLTGMGTLLQSNWTNNSQQVFVVNCPIPSYINDKSQMAFVGFVQDDGNQQIYQAARTARPAFPNDAQLNVIHLDPIVCASAVQPSITISNNGSGAITAFTLTPYIDGVAAPDITWTGNLAPAATVFLPMNIINTMPGSHTYAITIVSVSGGDVITTNNQRLVKFLNASGYFPAPYTEGFEGNSFPPINWLLKNHGGHNNYELFTAAGGYGASSQSAGYHLYSGLKGDKDELYLPPTDLVGTTGAQMSFDFAYQAKTGCNDSLFVLLSPDCGNSWTTVYKNGGQTMFTAQYFGNAGFVPASGQWTTVVVPLSPFTTTKNVLLKFMLQTDQGNGLFIDNVNLKAGTGTGPIGISESNIIELKYEVYPNPTKDIFKIKFFDTNRSRVEVAIINSLGQEILKTNTLVLADKNELQLDCSAIPEGIYFVEVRDNLGTATRKLVISR